MALQCPSPWPCQACPLCLRFSASVPDSFSALLCLHLCFCQFLSFLVSLDVSLSLWVISYRLPVLPLWAPARPSYLKSPPPRPQKCHLLPPSQLSHVFPFPPFSGSTDTCPLLPNSRLPYSPSRSAFKRHLYFEEPKFHKDGFLSQPCCIP